MKQEDNNLNLNLPEDKLQGIRDEIKSLLGSVPVSPGYELTMDRLNTEMGASEGAADGKQSVIQRVQSALNNVRDRESLPDDVKRALQNIELNLSQLVNGNADNLKQIIQTVQLDLQTVEGHQKDEEAKEMHSKMMGAVAAGATYSVSSLAAAELGPEGEKKNYDNPTVFQQLRSYLGFRDIGNWAGAEGAVVQSGSDEMLDQLDSGINFAAITPNERTV